jgi:hypothetical protein
MMRSVLRITGKELSSMGRISHLLRAMSLVALFLPVLAGCGGSSSSDDGDALTCDVNKSADTHICVASTGYGQTPGDSDATKANCTAAGGTLGTRCNLTGAVAGCRGAAAGNASVTVTYWFYGGTIDWVGKNCQAAGQTLVHPDGTATAVPAGDGGAG